VALDLWPCDEGSFSLSRYKVSLARQFFGRPANSNAADLESLTELFFGRDEIANFIGAGFEQLYEAFPQLVI
jgi:hypothetical protein